MPILANMYVKQDFQQRSYIRKYFRFLKFFRGFGHLIYFYPYSDLIEINPELEQFSAHGAFHYNRPKLFPLSLAL